MIERFLILCREPSENTDELVKVVGDLGICEVVTDTPSDAAVYYPDELMEGFKHLSGFSTSCRLITAWARAWMHLDQTSGTNRGNVWIIEDDVAATANSFRELVLLTRTFDADLSSWEVRSREQDPIWPHWHHGDRFFQEQVRSFNPLCRLSERLISITLEFRRNHGHFTFQEVLFASLAAAHGLSYLDWRNDHRSRKLFRTFRYTPEVSWPIRGISHPVKNKEIHTTICRKSTVRDRISKLGISHQSHPSFLSLRDSNDLEKASDEENSSAVLVIARYAESLEWLMEIPIDIKIVVYNKGEEINDLNLRKRILQLHRVENVGRESETYLRYLSSNDLVDAEWTIFCQGDPFAHSPDFIALLSKRKLWSEIQPLTLRYCEVANRPPSSLIEKQNEEHLDSAAVRTEIFSLNTLLPFNYHDVGATWIAEQYRNLHGLDSDEQLSKHFCEICQWDELADRAEGSDFGRMCYAAIFAVRSSRLSMIPDQVQEQMLNLTQVHDIYGYMFERFWLHFFGMPFYSFSNHAVVAIHE